MDNSIGDILNDEQPTPETEAPEVSEAQPEAVVAEPVAEEPKGPTRDEQGRFAKKEETGVEAQEAQPVPPTEQPNQLPPQEYAALRDERRKRQALEDEMRQMREHYARMQQPQQPQQPPVEFWDDPQSFMDQRMAQLGDELFQRFEQRQQIQRIDASEREARAKHADYDEAYRAFEQAVQTNPRLAYELAQAENPGEFAYSKGKTALEIQRVGSIDELRAQIRAELEAEARAVIQPVKAPLPSTTATDGSVGSRSGAGFAGPTPIGDILK